MCNICTFLFAGDSGNLIWPALDSAILLLFPGTLLISPRFQSSLLFPRLRGGERESDGAFNDGLLLLWTLVCKSSSRATSMLIGRSSKSKWIRINCVPSEHTCQSTSWKHYGHTVPRSAYDVVGESAKGALKTYVTKESNKVLRPWLSILSFRSLWTSSTILAKDWNADWPMFTRRNMKNWMLNVRV